MNNVPIYVYRCETCEEIFEEIQKVDEPAPAHPTEIERCPVYGGDDCQGCPCVLARQLTTAGHRFKGGELSNDGIAGYKRGPGDVMIKQHRGNNGAFYGQDRSGRQ